MKEYEKRFPPLKKGEILFFFNGGGRRERKTKRIFSLTNYKLNVKYF